MAQEFASDNSKNGLFDRLKLSNHRGFFSFLFISLSLILLLVTFAAVQQQQTTQSKAATNICSNINCSLIKIDRSGLNSGVQKVACAANPCCKVGTIEDLPIVGAIPICQIDFTKNLGCSAVTDFPYNSDAKKLICNGESVTILNATIKLSNISECMWKDNKCIDKVPTTDTGTTTQP